MFNAKKSFNHRLPFRYSPGLGHAPDKPWSRVHIDYAGSMDAVETHSKCLDVGATYHLNSNIIGNYSEAKDQFFKAWLPFGIAFTRGPDDKYQFSSAEHKIELPNSSQSYF